jgi:hypothetical protein
MADNRKYAITAAIPFGIDAVKNYNEYKLYQFSLISNYRIYRH